MHLDEETEFILIGTRQQSSKIDECSVTVGNLTLIRCNVQGIWGRVLTMATHVTKTCNAAYYYLHNNCTLIRCNVQGIWGRVLTMATHVTKTCNVAYYYLHNTKRIHNLRNPMMQSNIHLGCVRLTLYVA